jgi:hypothetical protein
VEYEKAIAEHDRVTGDDPENRVSPPCQPKKTKLRKCLLIPESEIPSPFGGDPEPEVIEKLPNSIELPESYPNKVTSETQSERELQSKVTQVTQVTVESTPFVKVGDRVRHRGQVWVISKVRETGILDLDHATELAATSAKPTEVELLEVAA